MNKTGGNVQTGTRTKTQNKNGRNFFCSKYCHHSQKFVKKCVTGWMGGRVGGWKGVCVIKAIPRTANTVKN